MKNLEVLRGNLKQDIAKAQAIRYTADAEGRSLNESEQRQVDELKSKIERQKHELDEEVKLQEKEERNATGKQEKAGQTGPEYRNMFKTANRDNGGFHSLGDFLQTIESGRTDSRLQKLDSRQMESDTGALGGFAVPTEYASEILDSALEDEIIRPRASVYPMNTGTRKVPCWDDLDRTGRSLYGGIKAQWTNELQVREDQEPELRELTLEAKKLILYVSASREVIQDRVQLEQELMKAMRKAISYELDYSFINGSGSGDPQGLLESNAVIEVQRQNASQVDYDDLIAMYSRLAKGGRGIWIASHSVLPQLMGMESTGGNLIWQPNARDGQPGNLLGMPVYASDKVPALGGVGDLMLVDPSKYYIGMRQEIIIDTSNAPGWYRDYTSWRIVLRAAGLCSWDKPMTTADGVTSLSPIVALGDA